MKRNPHVVACAGIAATVAILGCGRASDEETPAQHANEVHWSYEGETGPANWADLDEAFALCRVGRSQSPIDIVAAEAVEDSLAVERRLAAGVLTVENRDHVLDLYDNGHTIQITVDGGSTLDVDGIAFQLVQIHFHAPSEHTLDGISYPLEIHFVHASEAGELGVLASVFTVGAHNDNYQRLVADLPGTPDEGRHIEDFSPHADDLLPIHDEYFRYRGSLTTPPCTEGVRWVVLAKPNELSAEQLAAFDAVLDNNNRPVQALGGRRIGLISR